MKFLINSHVKAVMLFCLITCLPAMVFAQSIAVTSVATTPVCAGNNVTITFTTTNGNGSNNRYDNATVYTIYLSNASGTGYTSQGTFSTTGVSYSGANGGVTTGITRVFTIPSATATGTGYRISLGSTLPTFNGSGGAGASAAFTINAIPTTANAGPNQTGGSTCGLTQVTMAANTPTAGTGLWSIVSGTGGSFGTPSSPTSTFNGVAGNAYTLRWTISSGVCTPSTSDVNVTFNINSVAPTQANASQTTVCPSAPVTLSFTGGSLGTGATWNWYSGSCGGTPVGTGTSIIVNPTVSTTYFVRAEGVCGNTICQSVAITVSSGAAANIPGGITGNVITCNGATNVPYSVQPALNAASYDWTVPAGATITSGQGTRFITVDYPNPYTTGNICVAALNACGVSTTYRCLVVKNVANYNTGRISGSPNVCLNTTGLTFSTPNTDGATNFNWSVPTGMTITSGAGTSAITVSTGPSVTPGPMCVTVDNACGTSQARCINITVSLNVTPGTISGPSGVCANTSGLVYSVQPVAGATSYTWNAPSGFSIVSGQGSRIITVDIGATPVSGDVCVIANFACGASNPSCYSVVNTGTAPGNISGLALVCANTTGIAYSVPALTGASSYNWSFPAGMTQASGGNTRSITVDIGPGYTGGDLCVTATTLCGITTPSCKTIQNVSQATPGGITGAKIVCPSTSNLIYSVQPVSGASSYIWSVPTGMTIVSGGSSNAVTVDIGAGYTTGEICVVAVSSCATQSLPRCLDVSIVTLATPANISGPNAVCPNTANVIFTTPPVNGATSYNWTLPTGITFAVGPPTNTNSITVDIGPGYTSGQICVSINAACGTSLIKCDDINDMSLVTPGGITGPSLVCKNTTGLMYSVQPVSGATDYEWIVPPGITITAGATTRFITVDVDNSFTVGDIGVRAIAPCAIKSLIRWNTDITSINPEIPGTISASGAVCPSTTVTFSVSEVNGASSYIWTLPAGMTFTVGPPTNTNAVSVDIGAGFKQGDVCVRAVSACNVSGYMKCKTFNIVPSTPGSISGPTGVCPSETGIVYSVNAATGAASYVWTLPSGWIITAGNGTNFITVDVSAGFIQGQVSVHAVSDCGINGGKKVLTVNYSPSTPSAISGPQAVCDGNTVSYFVTAVPGATSYNWTLPTGVTFTPGPPTNTNTISVDVDNTFTGGQLCVTANSACGGVSNQRCFTLGTIPSTPAIIGDALVCAGTNSVVYSVPPVSGIITYTWTVPGNVTLVSGQGTSSITVDIGGGFTSGNICVTAMTSCAVMGPQRCLTISTTPAAPIAISTPVNFCPSTTKTLTVTDVPGAASYNWVLPSGLTEVYGQGTSSITVAVDGAFTSGLVCVNAVSTCSVSGTQYCETISSSPAGTPSSITVPAIICENSNMEFSMPTVAGAGSFTWTVPSGMTIVSGQGSATLVANANIGFSSGDVCVTAFSGCANAGSQTCKTVSTSPLLPGNIQAPASVCANDPEVIFAVSAVNGASSYNWTVPAGVTINSGQGSSAITTSVGPGFTSGQVSVSAVSSCAVAGPLRTTTVGSSLSNPGQMSSPTSVCPNATGLVFTVPQVTGAVSYDWTLPASFTITAGANTNSITVDVGPSFTTGQVCVAAVSVCGTPGTPRCINVNYLPNTPGGVTGTTKGVCDQTLQYSVSNALGAITYTWTPPAGASITGGQGTRIVQVTFTNTFTSGQLQVFASNACGNSGIRTSSIITGAPDKPSLISGPSSVCLNQTGVAFSIPSVFGAASYTWGGPSGTTVASGQGTTNVTFDWGTTAGNVTVNATNSCGSSIATVRPIIINCRVSMNTGSGLAFEVYPNPASEDFITQFDAITDGATYYFELHDLTGRMVAAKTETVVKGRNLVVMDVRKLPKGTYVLKVFGSDGHVGQARVILN